MQVLITHGSVARTRVLHFRRWQLAAAALGLAAGMLLIAGAGYHFLFLQAARERWPVVSQMVRWVVSEDIARQERFMRENLDAMAQKVGEMQARLISLQMAGERVAGMAGVQPEELLPPAPAASAGAGGPYRPAAGEPSLDGLAVALDELEDLATLNADLFTLAETRLFERRLQSLMVPSSRPLDGPVGSGFGFRSDPFNGRRALHTGLDFPAPLGSPIHAAAGGVVVSTATHPDYGQMLVIDHGNGLTTRYAHASRIRVAPGDLVRREQHVADVGSTGRSTGPHLHFEVLVEGVPQNPAKFLLGRVPGAGAAARQMAAGRVIN